MKKLTINFIGTDDGYRTVAGGNTYPKWDFQKDGMGEFVLMERKTLPNKLNGKTFDLYTAIHKDTKKPYAFFTGAVLEDKLRNIPLYSLVRIKFEGVHATKKYHIYKVDINDNFRYDPAVFTLDNYTEVNKDDSNPAFKAPVSNQSAAGTEKTNVAKQVEEDLPF